MLACSSALLALAAISGDFRTQIDQKIRQLEDAESGRQTLRVVVYIWLRVFAQLFGWKLLSWRFFVFTPVYTLIISVLVIGLWIVRENASLHGHPWMEEAIHQWFSFGIWIAIALDYVTVFLTKVSLRFLRRFGPFAFAVLSVSMIFFIYVIFTFVILGLRIYDMVLTYYLIAPDDPLPVISYELFPISIAQWVSLKPETVIYFTSHGAISTYFFPEPILFYCMTVTNFTLAFLTFAYVLAFLVRRAMHAASLMYGSVFDPAGRATVGQAKNVIVLILVVMLAALSIVTWPLIVITGRCLPGG
jgi:hypothetical protein